LQATRPAGQHYDYEVDSYLAAVYASARIPFLKRWELQIGARAEYLNYDYDNQMLDGNTRDDGTPCVWNSNEGCLYSRPADSSDNYFNFAPNVGLLYRFSEQTSGFANLTRGFRPPQATELYRLQTPQVTADIDSENLDSFETGIRHQGATFSAETVAYYMRKDNFIFRDAEGLNVSDGKTDHLGLEANIYWQPQDAWYFGFTGSLARHEYRFDRDASQGEVIVKGNRVDTAPTTLASARVGYIHRLGIAELEWVHNDAYYLDAANTATYSGHNLLNARFTLDINEHWGLSLRVTNLTDEVYADRGDLFAVPSPTYRYFPGHAREVFAGVSWRTE
jgi:outer membrane receptor protein involved in Fe transport